MARLFEQFLLQFFATEQTTYKINAPHLYWRTNGEPEHIAFIPRMRTDIVLQDSDRTIVIDAKFYAETLTEHFVNASVRSNHLYQLFTYMHHVDTSARRVSGVLIYPRTTKTVHINVELSGFDVQVVAIDLQLPWQQIHADLLEVVSRCASS